MGWLVGSSNKIIGDIELKTKLMTLLKEGFRPEFLNRIYEIVIFKALTKDEVKKIRVFCNLASKRRSMSNMTV